MLACDVAKAKGTVGRVAGHWTRTASAAESAQVRLLGDARARTDSTLRYHGETRPGRLPDGHLGGGNSIMCVLLPPSFRLTRTYSLTSDISSAHDLHGPGRGATSIVEQWRGSTILLSLERTAAIVMCMSEFTRIRQGLCFACLSKRRPGGVLNCVSSWQTPCHRRCLKRILHF